MMTLLSGLLGNSPVSRSAESLVIRGDNIEIGSVDAGGLRPLTRDIACRQAQIAEALDTLGLRRRSNPLQ